MCATEKMCIRDRLIRHDLRQSLLAVVGVVRNNHLTHCLNALALKEHVLCTAEADALCAKFASLMRIARGIRIGANLQLAVLVRPAHEYAEVASDGSRSGRDGFAVNVAGGAVNGNVIALVIGCLLYTSRCV